MQERLNRGETLDNVLAQVDTTLWKDAQAFRDWMLRTRRFEILPKLEETMQRVVANGGKQFLSLTGAYKAGGGFWYNVAPLIGGKIGKHVVPKNGVLPLETFKKIGRGDDRPLTNDEVSLYQQLVPAAFADGKVNLSLFYEGLAKSEPTVEIKTLGKKGDYSPTQRELTELQHSWLDSLDLEKRSEYRFSSETENQARYLEGKEWPAEDIAKALRMTKLEDEVRRVGERIGDVSAARYDSVAPKAEGYMPGYVEGLVRVPLAREERLKYMTDEEELQAVENGEVSLLYRGPHFGSEDTNVVGFFRGYMETLPSGEKAFHVIEVQSDWGQRRNEAISKNIKQEDGRWYIKNSIKASIDDTANQGFLTKDEAVRKMFELETGPMSTPDHPLLGAYENLSLKAAIKHARENGATKLVLSDAETAMMTEMHDTSATRVGPFVSREKAMSGPEYRDGEDGQYIVEDNGKFYVQHPVEQEGGMRLHYDTTLPSAMSKITGDKGTKVDVGVHKNAKAVRAPSAQEYAAQVAQGRTHEEIESFYGGPWVEGSPVFRNVDGTPKTNITGTVYDISKVGLSEAGKGQTFGANKPMFVGERKALGQLLKGVGLDESHVPEVSALVSLIDHPDVAWAQLENNGQTAGLFTKQTDGQKLVWLAASGDPATRTMFTLAHEYIGHYFQKGVAEGRYDAETTNKVNNFYKHIGENTPEQNSILLRELWSTLPKRYRKDAGLQKLVNDRLTDPEEVLANINGMFALTLVNKGRPGWINEVMTWLPKPVGDMLGVIAKHGRRIFEAISGLMFMRKQNWTTGVVDPAQAAQLHEYIKTLHSVLKADTRREQMTEYAIRQEMASDPRALMNSLVDGKLWEDGVTTAGNDLVREFRLLKEKDPVNPIREALGKVNRGLNHFLQPLVNFAQNMPWLRQTVVSSAIRQMDNNRMEGEILKEMGLEKHGLSYRWAKDVPTEKVMNSPKLATALNELVWRANPMEQTVEALIASGDPVVKATLSKLSAPEQQTVRETIAKHEVGHQRMNEMIREQEYERLVYATGETMMLKDPKLYHEPAEALARQLVDSVKAGAPMPHELTDFVTKQVGKIEDKFQSFTNRPYFVSARRFGDHAIKIVKADGTHSVENFYTPESLQSWMATNRDRIQSGEITPYRLKPEEAVTSNVGKTLLDMIKEREEARRPQIIAELTRTGLTQDQAESVAGRFSEAADLQQEIQAKMVPSMSPHRKFVDGYQNLNALRQQIEYAQMAIHSVTKGVDTARVNMGLMDPRVRGTPEAASIKQAWLQNKSPDMNATRLLQRAGYTWYMSAHLVNMLQDATTAMSGALFGNLVGDGGGVVGTGKRIMTAMRDVKAKSRQTAYEQQMLARYKAGNRGLATFSDEANNDYLASINALESASSKKISSMGDLLTKPIHHGFLSMRNFHKHFTDFGMESGMLATFRHFKAKGLSDADAEKAAFALSTVAMGGGKYNRAAGIWASGRLQPLSAMMTMLQGFAYNQMFTLKNFVAEGLKNTPGVTKEQRVTALKAAGVHSGLMLAQAGIFGLPLVAALMAINDWAFDTNTRKNIAGFIAENIDGPDSDMVRQIAMHGLVNAFGGVDYATKAQLPGVLGLNARDGFSLESLFGPAYGLAKVGAESVDSLLKGDVADAGTNILPNNFRRALQAYRDDWEFRRKDGSIIDDKTTDGDKALWALMGLKPRSVADTVERDLWQSIDAKNDATERSQWLDDIVDLFKENPAEARTQIIKRASERGEAPAGIANTVADRMLEMQMPRDAGRRAGASESVNRAAGVRPTVISEVQRLQAQQQLLQRLNMGMPATPATYRKAMMIDQVRGQNPWLSYEEAVNRVEQLTGASTRQQYRGMSYGMR